MKILTSNLLIIFLLILFSGCAKTQKTLIPVAGNYNFDKIEFEFYQQHFPKDESKYITKDFIEDKFNSEIIKNLTENNMLNKNSTDKLVISIYFRRIFKGEDFPIKKLRSDSIAFPRLSYSFKIIRNEKVLRYKERLNLIYNPGFIKNIQHILCLDETKER